MNKSFLIPLALILTMTVALAQSQGEMNTAAFKELEQVDAQLNKIYKELLSKGDDESDKALREAQRAWLKFVDLHINYVFPVKKGENPRDLYGSVYPMEYNMLKTQLFKERIKQLVNSNYK